MSSKRSRGDQVRAFIAVALSAANRDEVVAWIQAVRRPQDGIRWIAPENLHITMRFIGDMDRARIPALLAALEERAGSTPSFPVDWTRLAPFPNARRPAVMALYPRADEELGALARLAERAVRSVRLPRERRQFHAHLTVGRFRRRGAPPVELPDQDGGPVRTKVGALTLFESDLQPRGAVYRALGRVPLA